MQTGIKKTLECKVTDELSALSMGSGTLRVFATPAMISLIEECCWRSVETQLEEGQGTVGTLLNVKHLAPTPIGAMVRCESELVEVDGRRLSFAVNVFDDAGLIGSGTHERFIINETKFQRKADEKFSV